MDVLLSLLSTDTQLYYFLKIAYSPFTWVPLDILTPLLSVTSLLSPPSSRSYTVFTSPPSKVPHLPLRQNLRPL